MKVGFVQMRPVLYNRDRNLTRALRLIEKGKDAYLLVLPELFSTGYNFRNRAEAAKYAEEVPGGPTTSALIEAASEFRLYIAYGVAEKNPGKPYNTAALVGPKGFVGKYRKAHLFDREKLIYAPGNDGFPVFTAGRIKVGLLVCFDWIFPEAWRCLSIDGAQIVCHPVNLVLPGKCQRAMPTRATENRFFTITANRTGTEGDLNFTGHSIICAPDGRVLAEGPPKADSVTVVEINPAEAKNKWVTARNHALRDRRTELYSKLVRGDRK